MGEHFSPERYHRLFCHPVCQASGEEKNENRTIPLIYPPLVDKLKGFPLRETAIYFFSLSLFCVHSFTTPPTRTPPRTPPRTKTSKKVSYIFGRKFHQKKKTHTIRTDCSFPSSTLTSHIRHRWIVTNLQASCNLYGPISWKCVCGQC